MKRTQKRRILGVVGVFLGLAIVGRHLATRSQGPTSLGTSGTSRAGISAKSAAAPDPATLRPEITDERQTALLRAARSLLGGQDGGLPSGNNDKTGEEVVFVSLSRTDTTALVARGQGPTLDEAVAAAVTSLASRASPSEVRQGLIKIDVLAWQGPIERFDARGKSTIDRSLDGVLLPDTDLELLPEEILSRRLVDSSGDLQSGRLRRYLQEGGRPRRKLSGNPSKSGSPFRRLRFVSFMEGINGRSQRLFRGNPLHPPITPESLLAASRAGGEYLLRHHKANGDFDYSYEPKKDTYNDDYNLLRHAGSCYALSELSRVTGDVRYVESARRGIEALLTRSRAPLPKDGTDTFLSIVSPGEEAKLGGAALGVLAILGYQEASGDRRFEETAQDLARFLVFQQEADGHFRSKYFYGAPDPEPFESIYYPGEAILALIRLHSLDNAPRWLEAAQKGADWLIDVRDADKAVSDLPHDHWLLMGLNELQARTGDERYAAHGRKIAQAIVQAQRTTSPQRDWIGTFYDPPRSTPTATRAEALVAMTRLATRAGADPRPYVAALERMASFQLRTQLRRESSLYLPDPHRSDGGFRRSLTDWEVRIDYVQHNLSALIGLRSILLAQRSHPS